MPPSASWQTFAVVAGATILAALLPREGHAQAQAEQRSSAEERLGIYVDCTAFACDEEYLRTEMDFIAYLRDRRDADVAVLITAEPTEDGGSIAILQFTGQLEFAGLDQEVRQR